MASGYDIFISMGLDDNDYISKLSQAQEKTNKNTAAINTALNGMMAVGGAALIAVTTKASQFESKLKDVQTLLGPGSQGTIDKYSEQLLNLSNQIPLDIVNDFAAGLYNVVSATVPLNEQMNALELASKASVAGVAGLTETFDVGSKIIKGYGMEWSELEGVYDVIFMTIKEGVTTMGELASSLGGAVPIANAMGVEFEELAGATATLAGVTGTTSEAVNQITGVMGALLKPTGEMEHAFSKLGVASGQELISKMGSLSGAMDAIKGYTEETGIGIGKLIGRKEALTAFFALTGDMADAFADKTKKMRDANGAMVDAFGIKMNEFGSQGKLFKNIVETGFIDTGSKLLPMFTDILKYFNDHPEAIREVISTTLDLAIKIGGLAAAFKGVQLISKVYSAAMGAMKTSTGAFGLALTGLVLIYQAYTMYKEAQAKKAIQEIQGIDDEINKIQELGNKYNELKDKTDLSETQKLQLQKTSDELKAALEKEGKTIEEVTGNLQGYVNTANEANQQRLAEKIKETEDALKNINTEIEGNTTGWYRNYTVAKQQKGISEELNNNLNSLKEEYANVTDKMSANQKALDLLNTSTVTGKDAITEHVVKLQAAIAANEGNKEITDKLNQELEKYNKQIETASKSTEKHASLTDLLSDAGINLKSKLEKDIAVLKKLELRTRGMGFENDQLREKLVKLYEEIGDNDAIVKLYTGAGIAELKFKDFGTAIGDVRGQVQNTVPEMITLEDIQKNLSDAGIKTTESIESEIAGLEKLAPAVVGDAVASKDLLEKLKPLYEQLGKEEEFNKFVENAGLSSIATETFGEKSEWTKEKLPGYIGQIGGLAKEFLNLGPTASGAVDLLTEGLQGLLTGSIDPVSLGIKAAGLLFSAFSQEEEKVVLSTEQAYEQLGFLGQEVKNITEYMSGFNGSINSTLIDEASSALESWTEVFKNTQDTFAAERIAYWTEKLKELTSAFKITDDMQEAKDSIDLLMQKGLEMSDQFGGWDFPGVEGFATLLEEQISSMEMMLLQLDPTSKAYKELSAQLSIAKQMYDNLIDTSTELTSSLFNEVTGYSSVSDGQAKVADTMKAMAIAGTGYLDSKDNQFKKINDTISALTTENSQLDINSEQYKNNQDKILQLQYALASLNGYQENFYTWLQENGKSLNSVNSTLEENKKKVEDSGEAFHLLAEKVKITNTELGGLTQSLADEIDESISSLGDLSDKAITMKERYGDVKFPDMSADLQKAIADNEALLKTLDPNSKAYEELKKNIDDAKLALELINGEVENANQYYAEQITAVGMAGSTFDEKRKKMEDYLSTVIDTNAPLKDQLSNIEDIKNNMKEGTAEYVFMSQVIEEMKKKLGESNEELAKRKGLTDYLNDANIKTTESIRDQMNLYAGLASQMDKNSFEYRQLEGKIESVISSFVDSKAPMEEQIQQMIALRDTGGMGREAIEYLNQKIAEMQMQMADNEAVDKFNEGMDKIAEKSKTASENVKSFADLMGESKASVLDSLDGFEDLFKAFEQNEDYFGGMNDPSLQKNLTEWINSARQDLVKLQMAGGSNSQAFKDLSDKINLAKAAAAVMAGQFATIEDYLAANKVTLYDTGEAVETLADKLSNLGIETQESVYNQIKSYSDLASELQEGTYEYDQMTDKLDGLFGKFVDSKAPIDEQITQWESVLANLDETSFAYQYVTEMLENLKDGITDTNTELTEQEKLLLKLKELGIETADSVYSEIDALSKLADELENGSYEYEQVMQKMDGLFDKLVDTDAPLQNQLYQWEDILETLDETSAAYQYVSDKISELKHEMEEANSIQAQMEKLGIKTTDSVYDEIKAYGDLALKLEDGSYEYEQVIEKLDNLFKTFIDTNAPMENQILQWESILANLDETSFAYQYVTEMIENLKNGVTDANKELTEQEKLLLKLKELGIETADSVYEDIEAYLELADSLNKDSYEYQQLQDKVESLFGKLVDSNASIDDQIKQWEKLSQNLDESSEAYKYAIEKIEQLKKEAEDFKMESAGKELTEFNKKLKELEDKKISLKTEFDIDRNKLIKSIGDQNKKLKKLISDKWKFDYEIDIKIDQARSNVNNLGSVWNDLLDAARGSTDAFNLYEIAEQIETLTGKANTFRVAWDTATGRKISQYEEMMKGIKDIIGDGSDTMSLLDNFGFYGLEWDETDIDEKINYQIKKMEDYLKTLNPDSTAYKQALYLLDELKNEFTDLGGVIDENAASAFDFESEDVEDFLEKFEGQLEDLQDEKIMNDKQYNLQITEASLKLSELKTELSTLENEYAKMDIEIDADIELAKKEIEALKDLITDLKFDIDVDENGVVTLKKKPEFKEGGYVAATGEALLHAGEYVLPRSVSDNYSYEQMMRFIKSGGDTRYLQPQNQNVNVTVQPKFTVQNPGSDTQIVSSEDYLTKYLQKRARKTLTMSKYR